MTVPPAGTVTFLFTDLEGSTRLLHRLGREGYGRVLGEHHRLLREAFDRHRGHEVDTQGDAFFVAFRTASDAVSAAVAAQKALAEHTWPEGVEPRVRMGLHTGEALLDQDRYVGVAVHRAQRVSAAGHGGQVLLSNVTREMVEDELPTGVGLRDLGEQHLKDVDRPWRLYQLEIEGLPSEFPPPRAEAPPTLEGRAGAPPGLAAWLRRKPALSAAAASILAGLGVAAFVLLRPGDDGKGSRALLGDALAVIDPKSGHVTDRLAVGATPASVAVGEGGVWVLNSDDQTIAYVSPEKHEVSPFGTGATPTDLAVGEGSLWVGNGERLAGSQAVGPVATAVARVDPKTRTVRERIPLPRGSGAVSNVTEYHVAVGDKAVWAISPDYTIVRIDPSTRTVAQTIKSFPALAVAAAGREVWALGTDGTVGRIDPAKNTVGRRVRLRATALGALAVGAGAVWVTAPPDGTLWRIELSGGGQPSAIVVGEGALSVAVGEGSVWVGNPLRGTVVQVDPTGNAVRRRIELGGTPRALAVGEDAVWVAVTGTGGSVAAESASTKGALPTTICEKVFFGGGGAPDYLIASDLPLQGGVRVSTVEMSQAIEFVLRQRGFRAGRYRIGYQSCDDSVARTGLFDLDKCAANARQYAGNEKVIGVIGTFNSPCALEEVPVLNRAPGGGLAMVSPINSFVGLTRAGPGTPPGGLAQLYPTGRRNYFRVFPTDDYEGAGLALRAKQLGALRVTVLHDGDRFFSVPLVEAFRIAARRLGLNVRAVRRWDPNARGYRPLATAVERTRPDAVVLVGILDANAGQVIRDLRVVLGSRTKILGSSGLTPIALLFERAGRAAKGVYVSLLGFTPQRFPPAARRFIKEFGATQHTVEIQPTAVYAAQAAGVLLDAIGRSNGTRPSVIQELSKTRLERGLLGSFRFDRNGDTTRNSVTILRAERPGGRSTIMSFEGAAIDRVLTPPPNLVSG
jgi:branched-chain amino acid transport system substrate-binding protein